MDHHGRVFFTSTFQNGSVWAVYVGNALWVLQRERDTHNQGEREELVRLLTERECERERHVK